MNAFNISARLLSKIFWEVMLSKTEELGEERSDLNNSLKKLNELRKNAEYNTGSISFSSAWCLYNLVRYFKPKRIIEVGTFIGKSTISMIQAQDDEGIKEAEIFTCDFSNQISLPWNGETKIHQFQKQSSTEMLKKLTGVFDFLFFDGRLSEEDLVLLSKLISNKTIIVLDDFEGMEKGVINLINLRRIPQLANYILIYPPTEDTLKQYQFTTHALTAVMIPLEMISFVNQG